MPDRNWAEHDRRIENNPTPDECRETGRIHAAYGWSPTPWGHWTEEQRIAYLEGHEGRTPG